MGTIRPYLNGAPLGEEVDNADDPLAFSETMEIIEASDDEFGMHDYRRIGNINSALYGTFVSGCTQPRHSLPRHAASATHASDSH